MISTLISLLIGILVLGIIFVVIREIIALLGIPAPFSGWALAIVLIIGLLLLLNYLHIVF